MTWHGISGSLNEQVSHLFRICSNESIKGFAFRDRLALSLRLRRQLHWISRQLLNLALNRGTYPTGSSLEPVYGGIVEHILLISAINIEVLALLPWLSYTLKRTSYFTRSITGI